MKRPATIGVLVIAAVLAACSKDDGSLTDPAGDGGGGDVTVISMANENAWTFETSLNRPRTYWENGVFKCSVYIYGTSPNCSSLNRINSAVSANRIDFTQYKTCRVQFRAYARAHAFAWTGGAHARLTVIIHSNVPATPDLEVVEIQAEALSLSSTPDEMDQTFDLSLENALGFSEGTVGVYLDTVLNEPGQSPCNSEAFIEVHDFQVVGTIRKQ